MAVIQDPFHGLIDGVLQGHAIATQLRNQAMQEEMFQRQKMRADQENQLQDYMLHQNLLDRGARPVTNGMVQEPDVQSSVSTPLGIPGPGNTAPQSQADVSAPGILRKAGGNGRFVTSLKDSQGQTQQYEIPTADEQAQLQLNRALRGKAQTITAEAVDQADAARQVRQLMFSMPGMTVPAPAGYGLELAGYAPGTPVLRSELPGLIEKAQKIRSGNRLVTKPGETVYDQGPSDQAPAAAPDDFADLRAAAGGTAAPAALPDNPTANRMRVIASGGPPTAILTAASNAASREKIAGANRDAANTRATNRNSTTLAAAGIRRDTPTAGQAAVEGRFDQRRQDLAAKQMADVQAKESAIHAQRLQLGQMMMGADVKDADRQAANAKMKSLNFQVQAYQGRKAAIVGAQTPPKAIQDQIPEGKQATAPDGHTWAKKDGIVYFMK
jgi:hypothetical protein